jgi:hypothetical protein
VSSPQESRLAPARRPRGADEPTGPDYDDSDLARGQAAAVLGALGRMQLKLDVLTRGQGDALDGVVAALEDVQSRLARIEQLLDAEPRG